MATHEVNILGYTERTGDTFTQQPDSTVGLIEIKPPITVGEKFGAVILGVSDSAPTLAEVGSTSDATILMVKSGYYGANQESRQAQIQTVAARVLTFSNHPEASLQLLNDNPFPDRYSGRPL